MTKEARTVPVVASAKEDPAFFAHRLVIFDKLKAEQDKALAEKSRDPITITLPDGKEIPATAWETSPADIARGISKSLLDRTVIARVNGSLWDMTRPLEGDARLEFLDFNNDEAKKVYWHSSAHVLGEAAEKKFSCHLCFGPPTDEGFFYDFGMPDQHASVTADDQKQLKSLMDSVVKERQPFERLVMSKEDLLHMFEYNPFKQELIKSKVPDGTSTTVYRCGPLIDLCLGPHVIDTGRIKAFAILKTGASYFLGDPKNPPLQRVYGISFPDKKLLAAHLHYLEEAAKRDHRRIGKDQELFLFHDLSPGSPFFLPHGMRIYNALKSIIQSEYHKRDYVEVMSPNMFNADLWKQSGHWNHYQDDMFTFEVEKAKWALKPMNCPGHCLIFASRERSYRELPLRMAEFGILHRNEASGALTGLTRVRRFIQDDSHIFCSEDQIGPEITGLFDFLDTVYGKLGMQFKLKLSTRPEKFLGDVETWQKAEDTLQAALEQFAVSHGAQWELNPGDGAFYGPKIDITIMDALHRWHQCATIQLDFQLPRQFNLTFVTANTSSEGSAASKPVESARQPAAQLVDGAQSEPPKEGSKDAPKEVAKAVPAGHARPVMIHRAVVGSFERFIAVLTEHFAGKWPLWLSPRQILVVPVMTDAEPYVKEVEALLKENEFYADSDLSGNTMNKKIRNGQLLQYNFIFVLGAKEMENRTVSIRARDSKGDLATLPLDEALKKLRQLRDTRELNNTLE
ncbi:threonyl-tRNA synthetase [Sodiomyces alkalinus F11]|uniref:threonine--tRNA ligase n=1 Tax=Sodiomyces alkalinus (strain CBS 110278 / VKM F-3762 / F11) TaxID=1314773 RepID=A0A3N2Q433_SODAK|nr:threonyl-tRNA synthetase [Sodiomyces alkalinus F11]ROT41534.1 threonyl-tRNA synthetase [Sodiomyces alkalinus F11]